MRNATPEGVRGQVYGMKPACLCAHFHSGGRPGATVGLLPLVPLGLGAEAPKPLH